MLRLVVNPWSMPLKISTLYPQELKDARRQAALERVAEERVGACRRKCRYSDGPFPAVLLRNPEKKRQYQECSQKESEEIQHQRVGKKSNQDGEDHAQPPAHEKGIAALC